MENTSLLEVIRDLSRLHRSKDVTLLVDAALAQDATLFQQRMQDAQDLLAKRQKQSVDVVSSGPVSATPLELYITSDPTAVYNTPEDNELKMFFFVLKGLGTGKAVSQACHAMDQAADALVGSYKQAVFTGAPLSNQCTRYRKWRFKPTKVVRSADEAQLRHLCSHPEAVTIVDSDGDAFVPPGTLVCVAFPPRPAASMPADSRYHKLL